MTVARQQLIDIQSTSYYHVINRCVRRAFLCGEDSYSGKSYAHRRQWIVDKIKALSEVFAIDICAYAIMPNHYHLVLHVDHERAEDWDAKTVIQRWYELFKGNLLADKYLVGESLSQAELNTINDCVSLWRKRLMDISWYMRCLNESIAREANKEDQCTGRFWEGRFKSQALLDESALLTCMMYVDLNPIRAGITERLESSDFTSIQERIFSLARSMKKAQQKISKSTAKKPTKRSHKKSNTLYPFLGAERQDDLAGIAYSVIDYFKLIDWTGRAIREDKKAAIPKHIQPLLQKLHINEDAWLHGVCDFGQSFGSAVGSQSALKQHSVQLDKKWLRGVGVSKQLFVAV